jgi:hypothetical protein
MDLIDFTPVKKAGLKPSDLAPLVGVSRVTCSYWLNGYIQPHRFHRDKVQDLVDAVARATKSGLLPVPLSTMRRERAHYIRQAIDKVTSQ